MIVHIFKVKGSVVHIFLRGLACGMLAHHIFGLTDAFVLGTKLGAILWIFLGLVAAVFAHQENFVGQNTAESEGFVLQFNRPDRKQVILHVFNLLIGLGYWLLVSLAATTFINLSPYLSLGFVLIGGILLGFLLTKGFENWNSKLILDGV